MKSRRRLPSLYVADHASQVLDSDRLGDIDVHPSGFRASSGFRACDAGERGNVNPKKVETALVVADLRGGLKAVHDLNLDVSKVDRSIEAERTLPAYSCPSAQGSIVKERPGTFQEPRGRSLRSQIPA